MCDMYREAYSSSKNVYKCAKCVCTMNLIQKDTLWSGKTDSPVKKKTVSHADSHMKGPTTIDFLEKKKKKKAIVNCASYCQLLMLNSPYLLNNPHIVFPESNWLLT